MEWFDIFVVILFLIGVTAYPSWNLVLRLELNRGKQIKQSKQIKPSKQIKILSKLSKQIKILSKPSKQISELEKIFEG